MGMKSTIEKAVDTAFIKVGDLNRMATVTQRNVSGWDVENGRPIQSPDTFEVEMIKVKESISDTGVVMVDLIFKASQLPNDMSSKIVSNGEIFHVVPPIVNNGFIVEIKAKKEQ